MKTRKWGSVVMTLSGAALLVGACASESGAPTADDAIDEATQPSSDEDAGACNFGDAWHCEAAEEGWSWVDHPGGDSCCVNTGPEQPPRPYGT